MKLIAEGWGREVSESYGIAALHFLTQNCNPHKPIDTPIETTPHQIQSNPRDSTNAAVVVVVMEVFRFTVVVVLATRVAAVSLFKLT